MAALDFPASPTLNQTYPAPAVPGVPVYTWDGEKWTTTGGAVGSTGAADDPPLMDGTASVGSSTQWAREDHRHPSDTAKASVSYVDTQDALKAPLASPVFTGDPKAPTPSAGDNDTTIATTAFVQTAAANAVAAAPPGVRYDVTQSLTAAQQQQARQNIYAAPFDAMAYSGMQINGGFEVNQEGVASSVNNKYFCDGWQLIGVGTMVVTATQVVTNIPGFLAQAQFAVSIAQASLGAGDYLGLQQYIEGWRCVRLGWGAVNAQPLTISFWSAHHRTGIYSGAVRNKANNRTYTFTYTQNAADVPQYNTVTIPGDTTGTWTTDNTIGLGLFLMMACGSTYTAPTANTWLGATYAAAPGQINAVAATSDVFRITGVTVLPGNEAPSAARSAFIMRPHDQELIACKRYYYKRISSLVGYAAAGTLEGQWYAHPLSMRAMPTMAITGGAYTNTTTLFPTLIDADGFRIIASATITGVVGVDNFSTTADARL